MEAYLANGAMILGIQGLALLVVRTWFIRVDKRLDKLNGFKERMLANHVTKDDLARREDKCGETHRELFSRMHELEVNGSGNHVRQ